MAQHQSVSRHKSTLVFRGFFNVQYQQPTVKPCHCPLSKPKILKASPRDRQKSIPASSRERWCRTFVLKTWHLNMPCQVILLSPTLLLSKCQWFNRIDMAKLKSQLTSDFFQSQSLDHSAQVLNYLFCVCLLRPGWVITINLFWTLPLFSGKVKVCWIRRWWEYTCSEM